MGSNRRKFMCGCLACGFSTSFYGSVRAQDQDEDGVAVCGTDETAVQDGFAIDDFAAADKALEIRDTFEAFKITDYGTAMLPKRWRRKDGLKPNEQLITLGCFLMSGTPAQQDLVRRSAEGWLRGGVEELIRFDFSVPQEQSHIRILIGNSDRSMGNNSFIGRDALAIAKSKQTMNLINVTAGTIQHEFGHALGLLHEHMHPGFDGHLDAEVIITKMREAPNKWDESKTRRNILNRLGSETQCVGDPQFNPNSIMMYNIPPEWTKNNKGFKRSASIEKRDIACVRGIYSVGL